MRARFAQVDVERTAAAMTGMRGRDAGDAVAQLRCFEPERNAATKDAAGTSVYRVKTIGALALTPFAGDDQDGAETIGAGAEKERTQPPLGFSLSETMEIEPRIDLDVSARNAARLAAFNGHQRRGRLRQCGAGRWCRR